MYVCKSTSYDQNAYRSMRSAPTTYVAQWLESTATKLEVGGSNPDSPKSFTSLPKALETFESMPRGTDYPSINTIRSLIKNSDRNSHNLLSLARAVVRRRRRCSGGRLCASSSRSLNAAFRDPSWMCTWIIVVFINCSAKNEL